MADATVPYLQRSLGLPDSKQKTTGEPLWVGNPFNPIRVESRLAALDSQHSSLSRVEQRSSRARTSNLGGQLQSLCEEGRLEEALGVLVRIDQQGIVPSVDMYRSLLKACTKRKALGQAKRVHAHLVKHGLESTRFLGEYVVKALVKCGGLEDALQVFYRLPVRTVFSWTAVIAGYTSAGQGQEALSMYESMRQEGLEPTKYIFVSLLKACGSISDLETGKRIHGEAVAYRCDVDMFVGTCLVDMYAKCGSIVDAQKVFEGLSKRDVVSWTAMVAAYAQLGQAQKALQIYEQMSNEGVAPDNRTYVSALHACGMLVEQEGGGVVDAVWTRQRSLDLGKAIHADAWRKGYKSDVFIGNTLVSMYGKCGSIEDAEKVFNDLSQRDVVSWNAMLAAYTQRGQAEKALQLYERMREECVSPDDWTFTSTLQACGMIAEKEEDGVLDRRLESLKLGQAIHARALSKGYKSDLFIGVTLITMYSKCGSSVEAQKVFDGLLKRDIVSWNAMLDAYARLDQPEKTLELYGQMLEEGVTPNVRTFATALQACGMVADKEEDFVTDGRSTKIRGLEKGKAIHADAQSKGYHTEVFVGNSLITMYGKLGSLVEAKKAFDVLSKRDVVSWTAMLAVYVQQGQGEQALQLYQKMQQDGVSPNDITLVCILQACSNTGSLDMCVKVHQRLVSSSKALSPLLASTLIHTYGRCSSMVHAQILFDAVPMHDVVSWTALIAGYARQGDLETSLHYYHQMQLAGVNPNGVTFLALLAACGHAGLVHKGVEYFESMSKDYGITPGIEHYVSLVDLLGRAGHFTEVETLLATMPMQPDLSLWLCLLGGCRKHKKLVLGKQAFDHAVSLHPNHAAAYVLMSNIYADAGLWDSAKQLDQQRQEAAGEWKRPGRSWIEHAQTVHTFLVGGRKYQQHDQLYVMLGALDVELEQA